MEKFKVAIIFGEEACQAYNYGKDDWQEFKNAEGWEPDYKTFDTQAEMDAYIQGIEDAVGWSEYDIYDGEPED